MDVETGQTLRPIEAVDMDAEGELVADDPAAPPRVKKVPKRPTQEEIEIHRAQGHIPMRNWCEDCIEAFGISDPHKRAGEQQRTTCRALAEKKRTIEVLQSATVSENGLWAQEGQPPQLYNSTAPPGKRRRKRASNREPLAELL